VATVLVYVITNQGIVFPAQLLLLID